MMLGFSRFPGVLCGPITLYLLRTSSAALFDLKANKTDRDYQVWEEGSPPEQIQNPAMTVQKIEYIP